MPLSKGAKQVDGPFEGNGLEICRDIQGLMRRLELERGIKADVPQEQVPTPDSANPQQSGDST